MRVDQSGPVLAVGPVGVDIVMEGYAPTDPERLRTWAGPVEMRMLAAGSVGYAALALHGLGRRVLLASTVGDDHLGSEIRRQFEAAGLSGSAIETEPGDSSVAAYLRMFGDAKRPMVFRVGAHAPWPPAVRLVQQMEDAAPTALVISGALHFPEYAAETLGAVAAAAGERGIPVFVDPQFPPRPRSQPWADDLGELLAHTSLLCLDEGEGAHLFGSADVEEIIRASRRHGITTVVVKREHLGSVVDDGDGRHYQPAVSLGSGVGSTIGSGDAFFAGLVDAALGARPSHEMAAWATAAATAAITGSEGLRDVTTRRAARWERSIPAAQSLQPRPPTRTGATNEEARTENE